MSYTPPRYEDDPIQGSKILEDMANTYRERNALYKSNYLKVGKILAILYPEGVHLKTAEDFTRWHFIDWMIGKLSRFSVNNHPDSIHDLAVYAAMIEGWIKHEEKLGQPKNDLDKQKLGPNQSFKFIDNVPDAIQPFIQLEIADWISNGDKNKVYGILTPFGEVDFCCREKDGSITVGAERIMDEVILKKWADKIIRNQKKTGKWGDGGYVQGDCGGEIK